MWVKETNFTRRQSFKNSRRGDQDETNDQAIVAGDCRRHLWCVFIDRFRPERQHVAVGGQRSSQGWSAAHACERCRRCTKNDAACGGRRRGRCRRSRSSRHAGLCARHGQRRMGLPLRLRGRTRLDRTGLRMGHRSHPQVFCSVHLLDFAFIRSSPRLIGRLEPDSTTGLSRRHSGLDSVAARRAVTDELSAGPPLDSAQCRFHPECLMRQMHNVCARERRHDFP